MSTARINERILAAAGGCSRVDVCAVASRDLSKARAYAREHGLDLAYGSYEDLLADPTVDAVYISLPNHMHIDWTIEALDAGKHVLCEKPLTRDPRRAAEAFDAADRHELVLSEAFMWRHHPQTRRALDLVASGAIGAVREVRAFLGFDLEGTSNEARSGSGSPVPESWLEDVRISAAYEGGALMDVGAYCVNAIRLFGGEPTRVRATQEIGTTGVDVRTKGTLECVGGVRAQFECSFIDPRTERLEVIGESSSLEIQTPFLCHQPRIDLIAEGSRRSIATAESNPYGLELENVSDAVCGTGHALLGREDAVPQAIALAALQRSADEQVWIDIEADASEGL